MPTTSPAPPGPSRDPSHRITAPRALEMGWKPSQEGTLRPGPTRAAWPLGVFAPRPRLHPERWGPCRAQRSLPGGTCSLLCPAPQLTPGNATLTCEHSGRLGTVGLGHKVTDVSGSVARRRQAFDAERPHLKQHTGLCPCVRGPVCRLAGSPRPRQPHGVSCHPGRSGFRGHRSALQGGPCGDHRTQAQRCRDPHEPVFAGMPNQGAGPAVSSEPGQV